MKRLTTIVFFATLSLSARAQTPAQIADAQAFDQRGRDAILRGEPAQAVESFEKAVALKPNDGVYHYRLATASMAAGSEAGMFGAMPFARKAKAELERAIELDPNCVPARFELIQFLMGAPAALGGSETAAIAQANEIRKRDAVEGYRAFATIHAVAKKPDLARKDYADMMAAHASSARAHYLFGVYQMLTDKNYTVAGAEFESAARLDASYMPAYFQIGHVAALAANNFPRGEEALKKYLAYHPKDEEPSIARAYYWLGSVHEKQGKKGDAKSSYAAALKINAKQKDAEAALKRVS